MFVQFTFYLGLRLRFGFHPGLGSAHEAASKAMVLDPRPGLSPQNFYHYFLTADQAAAGRVRLDIGRLCLVVLGKG